MNTIKIGIDNGLDGSAFAITPAGGFTYCSFKPRIKTVAGEPCSVVEVSPLRTWLLSLQEASSTGYPIEVLTEAPAMNQGQGGLRGARGGTTAQAVASTCASFYLILHVLLEFTTPENIHICPAVTWQKYFWKSKNKVVDKPSIELAQKLFRWDFIRPGCKVPHDGTTDAALMAHALRDPSIRQALLGDLTKKEVKKAAKKAAKKLAKKFAKSLPPPLID